MTPSPLPPSASSPHTSTIRITHLLPLLLSLLTLLSPTHSTVATALPPPLRCATHPWSHPRDGRHGDDEKDSPPTRPTTLLAPDKFNDGYCDCPLDGGIDEPATGACSGAADGMWAGLPATEAEAEGRKIAHFACPQQPRLTLPPSRVRDGICDCCDGADEAGGGASSFCADVCDAVLAEERAMRAKVGKDYGIGSVTRNESIRAYDLWRSGVEDKLTRLTDGDMGEVDAKRSRVGEELYQVKVRWGEAWSKGVKAVLNSKELRAVVGEGDTGGEPLLNVSQLSAILLSLCQLSGEISSQNLSNGRCLPLERAAVDLGILWEYNPDETASSSSSSSSSLPKLTFLADGPGGNIMVADRVLLRLEGKDYVASASGGRHEKEKKGKHGNGNRRQERMMDHDVDDYYGDDYEDYHDYYSYDDEDEVDDESPTEKGEDPTKNVHSEQRDWNAENHSNLSPEETMVKSLLDAIPLAHDRKLFKRKAKSLLQYAPPEETENNHEHDQETVQGDGNTENDGSVASTFSSSAPSSDDGIKHNIDPMAIQMVKSTLSKRLSSISHGETSAESAARFVASLAKHHHHPPSVTTATNTPIAGTSHIRQLQNLILLVIYHGKISAADVAESIYAVSPDLTAGNVHEFEGRSCLSPVAASRMCPPRTIPLEHGGQQTFVPPSFLVEAANRRCREREDDGAMASAGTCPSAEDTPAVANGFPTTIPDGYFHYYEPKQRKDASDVDVDPFHTLFAALEDLHAIPDDIRDLQTQKQKIESEKKSLEKAIQTLQTEREQSTRYGYEGELYSLRDTCHSVESGKYEYEVCIFGQATQRDLGQSHGGTHLGSWESYSIDEETRQRTLKWGKGTKCWNGPVRSAEVEVTCGAETRLLTADEPETCRYVFRMESPIGCDEEYKSSNLI